MGCRWPLKKSFSFRYGILLLSNVSLGWGKTKVRSGLWSLKNVFYRALLAHKYPDRILNWNGTDGCISQGPAHVLFSFGCIKALEYLDNT